MEIGEEAVTAVVMGIMQDGGLPHIGCTCPRCLAAQADPSGRKYAACLAVVDAREPPPRIWLVDATPDIKDQLALLAPWLGPHPDRPRRLRQPDGIFLTHAHMGHIGGLPQFGPEAMAVQALPVYAPPRLVPLLAENKLWKPAVSGMVLRPLAMGEPLFLGPDLTITAVPVPHRDEWAAGTVAYLIQGPSRSLIYLPDIDDWSQWPQAQTSLAAVDVALVDASFYSMAELGGRAAVAHPLVPDTLARFANISGQLVLTHLNHTNPLLDEGSAARHAVEAEGVLVAERGMTFEL